MNHLDEGTIHAWLDGGLDAARAREAEAHARECEACAAAVAEARGLIAASSRILSALDDVPAHVIPAAAKPPTAAPKLMWRAAPWVTGIAAVLLAAIVLRTTRDTPDFARESAKMDEAQRTAQLTLDSMRPRQTESRPGLSPVSAPALSSRPSAASDAGAAAPMADRAAALTTEKAREEQIQRRLALAPPPSVSGGTAKGVVGGVRPDSLSAQDFAGCYVLERGQPERGRLDQAVAKVAEVAARSKTRTSAAAAPTVAAAPVTEYSGPPGETLVRLDTTRGRPGFLVRSATSDSSLGWWQPVSRDSARANLYTAVFTFMPAKRVRCP